MKTLSQAAVAATALAGGLWLASPSAPARAAAVPPPRIDVPATAPTQTAVFAGGCFWGMEGVFEHVKGVKSVVSGYAGGRKEDANYPAVGTERTGHAEAVRIVFDPKQVSYGQLLRIFFSSHNPTELNRQTPDTGPSYRSAVFPQDAAQRRAAVAYIAQLNAGHAFRLPVVTKLEAGGFFPAEAYHQGFERKHPDHPYIQHWDLPKLAALKANFPTYWRP